jgi:hypothetical protein
MERRIVHIITVLEAACAAGMLEGLQLMPLQPVTVFSHPAWQSAAVGEYTGQLVPSP